MVLPLKPTLLEGALFFPVSLPPVSEETDYVDLDLVEFHDEELRDIASILELSDTTKDKVTFTV